MIKTTKKLLHLSTLAVMLMCLAMTCDKPDPIETIQASIELASAFIVLAETYKEKRE